MGLKSWNCNCRNSINVFQNLLPNWAKLPKKFFLNSYSFFKKMNKSKKFSSVPPLFPQILKTLQGQTVIVELYNNLILKGILVSINFQMNIDLIDVEVLSASLFPQLPAISETFIRGSSIRYVHLPIEDFDFSRAHSLTKTHNDQVIQEMEFS